ncbi:dual specificity protein phosphatase family protein [Patescibacteria group bacterium]|nr:dual specificity protein phosphatase family protein [Patescibacteria group bacterium]
MGHDVPHFLEFNQITENIYIGTNMCCQVHFDEKLLSLGIEADISLEEERLDAPFGVNFFVWLPTKDLTPPTMDQLHFGVGSIEQLVSLGKKVYVHCKNGHGRAPTLVAAYLMKTGKSIDEALLFIKEKRQVIHLEDSQVEMLKTLAKDSAGEKF